MAVPKFYEFFFPILECVADGSVKSRRDIRAYCAKKKGLSASDLDEVIPSGQNMFWNRTNWACSYLKTAGLVKPGANKGDLIITEEGLAAFKKGKEAITLDFVESCPKFVEHVKEQKLAKSTESPLAKRVGAAEELDPKERIANAVKELNAALADELMDQVLKMTPRDFERLIVDLLSRMGYGDYEVTKASGDEGIDGVVYEDKFKFYSIYTQAKKWDRSRVVSRPEIQKFLGALAGQGATCGIFMTTARFSREAHEFALKQLNSKIRLVDGTELMRLMIEYGLGVEEEANYKVKRLNADFFSEES